MVKPRPETVFRPLRTLCAAALTTLMLAAPAFAQNQLERSFAVALIRDVMTVVNHGNWTGNYTVLRDYASRDFAEANDPTRLAGLFTDLRESGFDLLPILITEPRILRAQIAPGNTQIRLTGYFPTTPQHYSFDLVFVNENRRWQMLDISLGAFDPINAPSDQPEALAPQEPPDEGGDRATD